MESKGKFIISLDLELFWGTRDIHTVKDYGDNILGVWSVLPRKLTLFEKYKIRSTFAIVGFLFASKKADILRHSPNKKPEYKNQKLSPYNGYHKLVGESEEEDKFHYASELINTIRKYPEHEIATHTFSHYYCLEEGQTIDDFSHDLLSAFSIAEENRIELESLIFPRNQFEKEYLNVCIDFGITSYRGNSETWLYKSEKGERITPLKRALRLIDAYLNLSGHNCYSLKKIAQEKPFNIPSSRFLRPYSSKLRYLERLRLRRIKKSMTYAARKGLVYHLWWHPHNNGIYQEENLANLEEILSHYAWLKSRYKFESVTMRDLTRYLNEHYN
jgi:hypothetical protein